MATIAGLGLRYASSFRSLSGLRIESPTGDEWPHVYEATVRLLRHRAPQEVLAQSYSGVYVDEYQDCNVLQHEITMAIAEVLPCRLLGDYMQGIFDFRGQSPIVWERDVAPHFARLEDLSTPHRWLGSNADLGSWLTDARQQLLSGGEIDLRRFPGSWFPQDPSSAVAACRNTAESTDGSVVVIRKWRRHCPELASRLGGDFGAMEELDCEALMEFADELDQATSGHRWVVALLDFASKCFTVTGSRLASFRSQYDLGVIPNASRLGSNRPIVESLNSLASKPSASTLINAARALDRVPKARLYRRELWNEMKTTLRTYQGIESPTFRETAWQVRDRSRRNGRPAEERVVSTTLLVKGLEFDHSVVVDTDRLSAKELYVAMTRGRQGLAVVSESPVIRKDRVTNVLD